MLAFVNWKFILLDHVHFISWANLLFRSASTVRNFTHINRIVQNILDKVRGKAGNCAVLPDFLCIAVIVQIICNGNQSVIGMDIAVIDDANDLRFIFRNQQLTFLKTITIRSKAAVPFSLTCFLFTPCHCLRPNIFTLNFSYSRKDGNHQLARILRTVNAVLHANQIDTKILHKL